MKSFLRTSVRQRQRRLQVDSGARSEVNSIISELNLITGRLDELARDLKTRGDFQNIGSERCAQCMENVSSQYKWVRQQLRNL
jgi:hypothetical protein